MSQPGLPSFLRLATAVLLVLPVAAQAQSIYKCPDANGRVQFTDRPCTGHLQQGRVKARDNSLDASHARREVQRMRGERESAQMDAMPQIAVPRPALTPEQARKQAPYECQLAIRNAETQSMNASPFMVDADRDQARAICGFDPWPGPRLAEAAAAEAEQRRLDEIERERQHQEAAAAANREPHMDQLTKCNATGCWGANGARYNRTASGDFFRTDGRFCTRSGKSNVRCN